MVHSMNRWFIRIVSLVVTVAIFGAAGYFVVSSEQWKQAEQARADREQFMADLKESDRIRQEYFSEIDAKRALSKAQMDAAKKQYDDLVAKQPELVKSNQQTVTKIVTQTVPVTQTVKVPASTTSTRKTKSS